MGREDFNAHGNEAKHVTANGDQRVEEEKNDDDDDDDSWENFLISSSGCYTLRSITFVQSTLLEADVLLIAESLRLLEELKFVNVQMKGHSLLVLLNMSSLRTIEFVHCDFMTISFLNDLRKSILLGYEFKNELDVLEK